MTHYTKVIAVRVYSYPVPFEAQELIYTQFYV